MYASQSRTKSCAAPIWVPVPPRMVNVSWKSHGSHAFEKTNYVPSVHNTLYISILCACQTRSAQQTNRSTLLCSSRKVKKNFYPDISEVNMLLILMKVPTRTACTCVGSLQHNEYRSTSAFASFNHRLCHVHQVRTNNICSLNKWIPHCARSVYKGSLCTGAHRPGTVPAMRCNHPQFGRSGQTHLPGGELVRLRRWFQNLTIRHFETLGSMEPLARLQH